MTTNRYRIRNTQTVAAAGSNAQGTAAAINEGVRVVFVTASASTRGVILPNTTVAGIPVRVVNKASVTVNVYPYTGGTIDGGSANASIDIAATSSAEFITESSNVWHSLLGA